MLGILSAGIAPGLALLSYFYLKDEYEPEPVSFVFRTFLYGVLLVFPIMFIQHVLETEHLLKSDLLDAFFGSGILEEFFKWFILFYLIYQHVEFDEPFDGIVYGVSVSLGFATVENIFYLVANGIEHAMTRALLPVSSHALFGVIMGFYLGKAKFTKGNKAQWILLSLLLPILLHGSYDFILISLENWLYIILPFMVFLWWFGLRKVKKAKILSANHFKKQYPEQKAQAPI
ncbi:PrsW family intramembrane metalloprotease [Bacillus sp. AFS076308]|uniref:glutamic-type intramembrane protease PrsW n=1 Tax=unclassified Bacillus (in: firmicutes) TaxID=185979 RepID=UPI000BF5D924|nr:MULTISPECIES: glutamic-type intramembrane protease PrsW [unclassified Bacillus (in: firmicutes)]PFN78797.1 PrsW family intramembrane metalloprotease [Bacillus sp. AFS076308]PGV49028.1 PrsW family intramembrane metalloprotease [Bacillus sp. AFS037270]